MRAYIEYILVAGILAALVGLTGCGEDDTESSQKTLLVSQVVGYYDACGELHVLGEDKQVFPFGLKPLVKLPQVELKPGRGCGFVTTADKVTISTNAEGKPNCDYNATLAHEILHLLGGIHGDLFEILIQQCVLQREEQQ